MAVTGIDLGSITMAAGADLSAKQYYIVYCSAADTVALAGTSNPPLGVLTNAPTSGAAGRVQVLGVVEVLCGGTVSAGNKVGADSNGKAVAKSSDADHVLGIALTAGTSGTRCKVLLTPGTQRAS